MMSGRDSEISRTQARRDELINLIDRTRARVEAVEAAMAKADDMPPAAKDREKWDNVN